MNNTEEMNRRIESGEFGSPPDFNKINEAWADLLETEMLSLIHI